MLELLGFLFFRGGPGRALGRKCSGPGKFLFRNCLCSNAIERNKHYLPSATNIKHIHYIPKMSPTKKKKTCESRFFCTVFSCLWFRKSVTYKIKSTSVDDLCPYYKIKQIFDILIYLMNIWIYLYISWFILALFKQTCNILQCTGFNHHQIDTTW